jgi:hypothetical protein
MSPRGSLPLHAVLTRTHFAVIIISCQPAPAAPSIGARRAHLIARDRFTPKQQPLAFIAMSFT